MKNYLKLIKLINSKSDNSSITAVDIIQIVTLSYDKYKKHYIIFLYKEFLQKFINVPIFFLYISFWQIWQTLIKQYFRITKNKVYQQGIVQENQISGLWFKGTVKRLYTGVYFKRIFKNLFYPCVRYGRFYGVTDRSNHRWTNWTGPWHHNLDRSDQGVWFNFFK